MHLPPVTQVTLGVIAQDALVQVLGQPIGLQIGLILPRNNSTAAAIEAAVPFGVQVVPPEVLPLVAALVIEPGYLVLQRIANLGVPVGLGEPEPRKVDEGHMPIVEKEGALALKLENVPEVLFLLKERKRRVLLRLFNRYQKYMLTSSADVKMEMPVLVRSLKASILSSISYRMYKTFWEAVSAAVEQSRRKAKVVDQGDGKFGP